VQWSEGEPSTVTLVKLPSTKTIGLTSPFRVTTGVTYEVGIIGGFDTVNTDPSLAHLVSGEGVYFLENATVYFDENNKYGHIFEYWTDEKGVVMSYDNPYTYDGSRGDIILIAKIMEGLIS
jgi:hypothetical protein